MADDLRDVFVAFASFGSSAKASDMDGAKFAKLCKDCKLISKKFTTTDVDLTYAKAKAKGERKINFEQFTKALELIAEKKGCPVDEVTAAIVSAGGPTSSGTQAEAVKFHDDKSLYTGVHAKGGPTNVDKDKITLSSLADRSAADVRGIQTKDAKPAVTEKKAASSRQVAPLAPPSPKASSAAAPPSPKVGGAPVGSLEELFVAFASFGGSKTVNEMDGTKFAKLCKDTGLIDKKFTTTSADIIFSKVKAKGERKITYEGFAKALPLIAAEKGGMDVEAMKAKLLAAGGPIANGTKAEAVKFHDDKSLYTGVHAKGGPSTVDNKISLSNLADRSAADVRGIKISD